MTNAEGTRTRRGPRSFLVIGGSALAAMTLVGALLLWQPSPCGWFSGQSGTATGECVGVLHGDDHTGYPAVDSIIDRINTSNVDAEKDPAYVTIVVLTPLTVPKDPGALTAIPPAQIRSSLEGTFTALTRANATPDFFYKKTPAIRLVLANQGSRQEAQDTGTLVDGILGEDEPEHPVVAVVGLGSSLPGTAAVAKDLSSHGIPMVSAIASAGTLDPRPENLDARNVPELRSVSPSNGQYALALQAFLDNQSVLGRGVIVADKNDDAYASTLRDAFGAGLRRYLIDPDPLVFHGGTVDTQATAGDFNSAVLGICNDVVDATRQLNTVFYAGRVSDFRGFVDALAARRCKSDRPLAILVGATGFDAARSYQDKIEAAGLTVIYATSADPDSWMGNRPGTPRFFAAFLSRYLEYGFDPGSLGDGYAIMYHDALASAVVAVRLAGQGDQFRPAPPVRPADVSTQLDNIAGAFPVPGASGTLGFPSRSTDGRALGKVIPMRQIQLRTPYLMPEHGCIYVVGEPCIPS